MFIVSIKKQLEQLPLVNEEIIMELLTSRRNEIVNRKILNLIFMFATKNNYVSVMKWVMKEFKYTPRKEVFSLAMRTVCSEGYTDVLNYWSTINFSIDSDDFYIFEAASKGYLEVLEWITKNFSTLYFDTEEITYFIEKGNIEVLQWFKDNNLLGDDKWVTLSASRYGYVNVLNWNKECDFLECSKESIAIASKYGHVNVLQWWMDNIFNFEYDINALNNVKDTETFDWWINSALELKYDKHALLNLSYCGNLKMLNKWLQSGLPLLFDSKVIKFENSTKTIHHSNIPKSYYSVLKWWTDNFDIKPNNNNETIEFLSCFCDTKTLELWISLGFKFEYGTNVFDWASIKGNIKFMNWWFNSGLELKYTSLSTVITSIANIVPVLNWWINSGLEIKFDEHNVLTAIKTYSKCKDIKNLWIEIYKKNPTNIKMWTALYL